ncbi:GNAT family N-acetyltransferase [Nonomuraea sp. NPDC050328]|uniref:GNAT family N-acetyltransferase n=1 Tax=Nonomuraea sp. NPDC050328 TaxID=3364361 RepID=UPI00378CF97B
MLGTQIRPVTPEDEEALTRFLSGLSLHTQTLRFFSGLGRPSPCLVRGLLAVDETRDAMVAVLEGEIVGHAMSYRGGPVGADVEIGVVVADQWQGVGIGPRLIDAILSRAWFRGAETVGMDVLGENRRVLRMIRRAWPEARYSVSSGAVEVIAMIGPAGLFAE